MIHVDGCLLKEGFEIDDQDSKCEEVPSLRLRPLGAVRKDILQAVEEVHQNHGNAFDESSEGAMWVRRNRARRHTFSIVGTFLGPLGIQHSPGRAASYMTANS